MKFILSFLCIAAGAAAIQLYFPWWTMTIVCFVIGGIAGMKGFDSFFTGFLAIALLWGGYAFYLDMNTSGLLSDKMALLFSKDIDGMMLILITAVLGGLVGGLAAMTGSLGRNLFKN